MYQVLLVDDEPLILSGIKFLIDWEKNGCEIMDTARNGQQALEKLRARRPDIVICDIAMPVMSGGELLEQAAKEFPDVVFIMLTNHPDFHLIQHSMRHRAVDYLLKGDLDAPALERSLAIAKEKAADHARMARADRMDGYLERARLRPALLYLTGERPGDGSEDGVLAAQGMLNGYAVARLSLTFDRPGAGAPDGERGGPLDWAGALCDETASGVFPRHAVTLPDGAGEGRLYLVCWDLPAGGWRESFRTCVQRAASACATVLQARLSAAVTDRFDGPEDIPACRRQLQAMAEPGAAQGDGPLFYSRLSGAPGTDGHAPLLEKARQYVRDNADKRIMLQDIADHVGISPGYLSTLFKKRYGKNLVDYINEVKTGRACQLLRSGRYRIYEVSFMLGFENAYYFARVFKRYVGMTPAEYQKQERREALPSEETEVIP